jgi:hypothetical protein
MRPSLRSAAIAALVVASAAAGWLVGRSAEGSPAEPERPSDPDATDPCADDPALAACRETLVRRDAELFAARRLASRAIAGDPFGSPEEPAPDPAAPAEGHVKAHDGRGWVEVPDPVAEAARRLDIRERVGTSLAEHLRLTEEEAEATKVLICAMRANQRLLFREFSEGRLADEALWRSLGEDRETTTEGLRRTLGAARFERLQALGGVPIWSQTLCQRR